MSSQIFNYAGAIHIHSKFSDGTGDIKKISKAAKKAGLNWIIITDHNNFDIEEGFYNGVCVIKGEEISPGTSNHYLALGINELIMPENNPQININKVKEAGGFGFAAHPDESINRKNKYNPIKWTDKTIIPDGIEIWNWFSDWADNYNETNIFTIAYSWFFRKKLIKGPKKETLIWWDELNKNLKQIVPAIGGVDAHALLIKKYIIPVKVFSYEYSFKTLTNLLQLSEKMPDDFKSQKELILNSLKSGKNILIDRNICKDYPTIEITKSNEFNIKLPVKAEINIIANGEKIYCINTKKYSFLMNPSVKYRIEVFYKNRPWIFTNPVTSNL